MSITSAAAGKAKNSNANRGTKQDSFLMACPPSRIERYCLERLDLEASLVNRPGRKYHPAAGVLFSPPIALDVFVGTMSLLRGRIEGE